MSTSFAKTVQDLHAESILDRYGSSREEFNQAGDISQLYEIQQPEHGEQSSERPSDMIAADRPAEDMRPPQEIARDADRESFDQRWEAERQDAAQDSQDHQIERHQDFER